MDGRPMRQDRDERAAEGCRPKTLRPMRATASRVSRAFRLAFARPPALLGAVLALLVLLGPAGAAEFADWSLRGADLADLPDFAGAGGLREALAAWTLPPIETRSLLRMVHLVGLCLGFGTTLMLDASLVAWIRTGRAPGHGAELLRAGGRMVLLGFALLWASGLALTALAVSGDPSFLASAKLWAKVIVVTALTINALVLHRKVLSPFSQSLDRSIDGRWRGRERQMFIACGAVSSASWILAFMLGVIREWNHTAPLGALLSFWLLAILMTALAIGLVLPAALPSLPYQGMDRRRARSAPQAAPAQPSPHG